MGVLRCFWGLLGAGSVASVLGACRGAGASTGASRGAGMMDASKGADGVCWDVDGGVRVLVGVLGC